MKIHITNTYGNFGNSIFDLQQRIARLGGQLGFNELGIYRYDVSSDSQEELGKRLDGIISSVEAGDIVAIQLPTGNDINFEKRLVAKLRGFVGIRLVFIVHDSSSYKDMSIFGFCDKLIYPTNDIVKDINKKKLYGTIQKRVSFNGLSDNLIKKNLIDITEFYDDAEKDKLEDIEDGVVHAALGIYDKTGSYTLYAGATIESALEHTTSKVCFHIFHDDTMSPANRYKLKKTVGDFGQYIMFHLVDGNEFKSDNEWVSYYTIGAMFRLVMPRVLKDLHKLIYLDSDLFFNRDIKELWDIDVTDYSIAAVKDVIFHNGIKQPKFVKEGYVNKNDYFNSGVLVMNLDKIREKGDLLELALEFLNNNPDSALPDQDALNYYFNSTTLFLDKDWNVFSQYEKKRTQKMRDNVLYHFMGQPRIDYFTPSDFEKEYLKTKEKSAWGYDGIEAEVFRGYFSLSDKVTNLQAFTKKVHDGCKKIIYAYHTATLENLVELFPLGKDDYFITDEPEEYGKKLFGKTFHPIDSLKDEKRGEYVILIAPQANYGRAIDNIKELGLTEREDYFIIPKILTGPQGGYWA